MAAEKKTISLPAEMFADATERAERMGYTNFSEYIRYLVQRDLAERPRHSVITPSHSIIREEPPER